MTTWIDYKNSQSSLDVAKSAAYSILQAYALGDYTTQGAVDMFEYCIDNATNAEEAQAFRDAMAGMDAI